MKKSVSVVLILIICAAGLKGVFAQNIDLNASSFAEKVDSVVINQMDRYNIPGIAIGIVKDDSVWYSKGYGLKKIGSSDKVSQHSIFHTASISKLFTAQAIMHLVEKEVITLGDQIANVISELDYSDERVKEITIKQLLNHTSGLPDINNYHWENNHQSENSLRNYILGLDLKVSSDPSQEYHYSNLGYDILGYLIESVSGVTFEEYVKNEVLNPSRMTGSDFRYFKIPDSLRVSPHSKTWMTQKIYPKKVYPYTREHAPSSTLNASVKDLSKWMIFFLKKLKNGDSTTIYRTMVEPSFRDYPHIGLGFQLFDFEKHKAVGHFGGDKGFRSFLMMIPEENIGLVVLGNCDYEEDYRQEIIYPLARLMLGE